MTILHVTDSNFNEQIKQADGLVLVDYWAEWCGPCKVIGPILDDVANIMQGKVTIAKMDIDENPETPTNYGIRSIPTLMLFRGGEVLDTVSGAMSQQQLTSWLEQHI